MAVSPHVNSAVMLLSWIVLPNEDECVKKRFEKIGGTYCSLTKKLLAEASNLKVCIQGEHPIGLAAELAVFCRLFKPRGYFGGANGCNHSSGGIENFNRAGGGVGASETAYFNLPSDDLPSGMAAVCAE